MKTVKVAGDSNIPTYMQAVAERVKGDARVQVGAFPGQTVRTVFEKAKDKLMETKKGLNIVVIPGGVSDVLR